VYIGTLNAAAFRLSAPSQVPLARVMRKKNLFYQGSSSPSFSARSRSMVSRGRIPTSSILSTVNFCLPGGRSYLKVIVLVGAGRFERPTPCAQGRCATRLRYAPTLYLSDSKLLPRAMQRPLLQPWQNPGLGGNRCKYRGAYTQRIGQTGGYPNLTTLPAPLRQSHCDQGRNRRRDLFSRRR
jgi:hypothetical protein